MELDVNAANNLTPDVLNILSLQQLTVLTPPFCGGIDLQQFRAIVANASSDPDPHFLLNVGQPGHITAANLAVIPTGVLVAAWNSGVNGIGAFVNADWNELSPEQQKALMSIADFPVPVGSVGTSSPYPVTAVLPVASSANENSEQTLSADTVSLQLTQVMSTHTAGAGEIGAFAVGSSILLNQPLVVAMATATAHS